MALDGLSHVGSDGGLWALVADAYALRGDMAAAIRAQRASLAREGTNASGRTRLGQMYDLIGQSEVAEKAWEVADSIEVALLRGG